MLKRTAFGKTIKGRTGDAYDRLELAIIAGQNVVEQGRAAQKHMNKILSDLVEAEKKLDAIWEAWLLWHEGEDIPNPPLAMRKAILACMPEHE